VAKSDTSLILRRFSRIPHSIESRPYSPSRLERRAYIWIGWWTNWGLQDVLSIWTSFTQVGDFIFRIADIWSGSASMPRWVT